VEYSGGLVGAQLGGVLTDKGPWLSILVGFGIVVLGSLGVFALPETMHLKAATTGVVGDGEPSPAESVDVLSESNEMTNKSVISEGIALMKSRMREAVTFLYGNTHLMMLLLALVFSVVGKYVQNLLLQYARKRYGISWGQVSGRSFALYFLVRFSQAL
jgi:hypothetical protein